MNQEEQYNEFDKKYEKIVSDYDIRKIKKPENYNNLTYEDEEKQNYAQKVANMYIAFSNEMYKLIEEMNKYMNETKKRENIIQELKELRIDCIMMYIQSLQEKTKIDNEIHSFNMMKAYQNILSHKKELKKLIKDGEERDKKILEMMGIFLSIFSLIGVNLSFFSNIKDIDIWNILLLIVVINVLLSDAIKVIFSIIRKEKVETIVEKIFRKIITCIKEKTK
ncbi:hypothetical protein [uncultured Leptotrichia sp.]|uniref:hypothetical protein n=1 Tax=uncultured Leptotrichia sp. TaxID=159271 RepID=UPI0025E895D4|nr:hypothetical protein [uncultured Leptotrichia sp.]